VFRRILVGFDGSPQSRKALTTALELARAIESTVDALIVVRPPEFAELEGEVQAAMAEANGPLAESIKWAKAEAARLGLSLHVHKQLGHPAETLVRVAEEKEFDLIVMGRRGHSAVTRWMLGSISERVLRYAHCPVMVVH
jgi:nucleotide-binding universal stress UspA family protein